MDLTLLVFLLLPVVAASHKVDLPPKVVFKMGDRRELTCSMRSCPGELKFVWTPLEDKPLFAAVKNKPTESVLIFENVTRNHENTVLCKATCGKETKQAKTTIKVYSFPRNPVISGNDGLILGEENVLTCEVSHVYPSEFLEVELLQGDTVLQAKEGEPNTDGLLISHKFKPSSADDGNAVTCRASLNMDSIPSDGMIRETSGHLSVLSAPHNVRVSGFAAVSLGSGLTLTCEAEGSPEPAFTWTALKPDGQRVEMGKLRELFVRNVSLTDTGIYRCEVSNRLGSQTADVSVVVKAPPMETIIEARPQTVLKEGESISIYCKSDRVPVERVVLRLMVDGRETELKTSVGAETTFTLDSVKLSDSGLYVCEAFNEYGRQRATLSLTVETHLLEVVLQPDGVIVAERGSGHALSCQASGCPQPTFSWRRLENLPTRGLTETIGFLSQLFLDPVELEDEGTYICEVTCGSVAESKQTEMKLFSFPTSPVLESSGPSLEGETVRLTCSVRDVFPADIFRITWMDGERELISESGTFSSRPQNLTSVLSYDIEAKDKDKSITCKVLLDIDGVPAAQAVKTSSTTLSLHYPPRGTRITVSPQVDLKEGESVSISCLSDSVPVGRVVLRRVVDAIETELKANEGAETSVILPSVDLDDSGLYVCEAFNQYGSHRDSVQVIVKTPPRNTTVEVLPSSEVQEGQNITICCNSVSFPPPAVVLRKLDSDSVIYSPDGVFQLINLTPNDTGLYQVNVTNDLGYETEIFLINVKEKRFESPPSWNDFVTAAVCLGSALALLGIVVYLWRESKKGSYDLTKCNPDTV
ncbi:vascular cell adhesion protein 1b [Triplophysa rosa]|uniref:Vascular cell adhesion protein 1 n=1 Tax=Triplophysa rosa TaxID=992332 RepID=A0A9W7W8K7_TRIRA|nr:vascular cell adhesion protein 1b [Triplophysa rosa]KAI7791251.1 vascular cell adhesion protein 1 precursor [Triplophysa rosa]